MRYLIAVGICTVFLVGDIVNSHSSMYWDFETSDLETMGEPEVATQDRQPAQPTIKMAPKMYDDYELPDFEPLSMEERPRTAPMRSTEDSVSAPVVRPMTPRRTQQPAPQDTSVQTVSPRPAITQPGAQSVPTPPAEQPAQVSTPSVDTQAPSKRTDVQQPVTKKMKWGKTDSAK